MAQNIDGNTYSASDLQRMRNEQLDILKKDPGNADAICELVCADVCQIAAEHLYNQPRLKLKLMELQREAVIALFIISTLSLVFSAFAQTYETNYLLGNFIRAEKN